MDISRHLKSKKWDKDKNNKLMCFHIQDKKLLEKYKAIWTKIEKYWIKCFTILL